MAPRAAPNRSSSTPATTPPMVSARASAYAACVKEREAEFSLGAVLLDAASGALTAAGDVVSAGLDAIGDVLKKALRWIEMHQDEIVAGAVVVLVVAGVVLLVLGTGGGAVLLAGAGGAVAVGA